MRARPGTDVKTRIVAVESGEPTPRFDRLATEEPLEIRLQAGHQRRSVAVTMRTPGADFELAAGFLYSEGVVADKDAIRAMSYCVDRDLDERQQLNVVNVDLAAPRLPDLDALERNFFVSSACGVCGKTAVDSLRLGRRPTISAGPELRPDVFAGLPERLRAAQDVFSSTGGLHAAALFDGGGELIAVREDVGRHNALDKLVGWALVDGRLPLADRIVLVSGRASFELVQKCAMAGAPVLCAVSAPSSLAVELADGVGITLIGFLRSSRFNVYAHPERVRLETAAARPN